MREISIQLREITIENYRDLSLDCYNHSFDLGCGNGWDYDYNVNSMLSLADIGLIEWSEVKYCAERYDIGFMHTLYKPNDDDEFDFKFRYSIRAINIVGTNQRVNHFLNNFKQAQMRDYVR